MYHAVCRVNYQNKAGRTNMAMKEKLGKETEEREHVAHIKRHSL